MDDETANKLIALLPTDLRYVLQQVCKEIDLSKPTPLPETSLFKLLVAIFPFVNSDLCPICGKANHNGHIKICVNTQSKNKGG